MLKGWDGADDTLQVEETDQGVRIHIVFRKRVERCVTVGGEGELITPREECFEDIEVEEVRDLELDRRLWRRPRPKRSPPADAPPDEPPSDEPPSDLPPEGTSDEPAILSLMHARSYKPRILDILVEADPIMIDLVSRHERFKISVRASKWRDPFVTNPHDIDPRLLAEARDRARPPKPPKMSNSMANHANPFSEARLGRLMHLPPPPWLIKPHIEPGPMGPSVDRPDYACTKDWGDRWELDHAPGLACFRSVERAGRLDGAGYEVAGWLAQLLPYPLNIIPAEVAKDAMREAVNENVSGLIWSVAWLNWANGHRTGLRPAIANLTVPERMELRRRLYGWWGDDGYKDYHDVIAQLYEEHLVQFYPGLAGADGLPVRRLFGSDFLWGTNWVAELSTGGTRDPRTVVRTLRGDEKKIVVSVAALPRLARRYPRVVEAARL